jgi:hypothetical protein
VSQFQLPDGTRVWAEGYDNEKIAIRLRNEIELEQWGSTDWEGKTADIQVNKLPVRKVTSRDDVKYDPNVMHKRNRVPTFPIKAFPLFWPAMSLRKKLDFQKGFAQPPKGLRIEGGLVKLILEERESS